MPAAATDEGVLPSGQRSIRSVNLRHLSLLRITVFLALFAGAIDQTAIAALLPAIVRDFAVPFDRLDDAAWTVTAYLGVYAAVLSIAGRAIDRGSGDVVRVAAIVLFGGGSIGCALAGDLLPLTLARAAQAAGAGVLVPLALSDAATERDRDRRLGRLGLVMAIAEGGAVLGPLYGAAFLTFLDWRWAFWANVPVALGLLAVWAPRLRAAGGGGLRRAISGADVLAAIAIAALVIGVSREALHRASWLPWVSGVAAGVFVIAAARAGMWTGATQRVRSAAALLAHLWLGVALVTPLVLVPVWANTLLGRTPEQAALLLVRFTIPIPVLAVIGAFGAPRIGRRVVAASGFVVAALGLFLMSRWSADVAEAGMTPALLVTGAGLGLLLAPTTESLLDLSEADDAAARLGWATATRVIGMAAGVAGMTVWGVDRFTERLRELVVELGGLMDATELAARAELYRRAASQAGVEVFGTLFLVGALSALLGAVAVAVAIRPRGITE